jgi:hypothetical protein
VPAYTRRPHPHPEAQCNSVGFSPYGTSCAFFGQPATITGAWDPTRCTLSLTVTGARTCCNTFPFAYVLLLGAMPIDPGLPHPILLPGCLLAVVPDVVLAQPVAAGSMFQFTLPPLPRTTLFVQGAVDYFTSIGQTHDFQTTDAVKIGIQ